MEAYFLLRFILGRQAIDLLWAGRQRPRLFPASATILMDLGSSTFSYKWLYLEPSGDISNNSDSYFTTFILNFIVIIIIMIIVAYLGNKLSYPEERDIWRPGGSSSGCLEELAQPMCGDLFYLLTLLGWSARYLLYYV